MYKLKQISYLLIELLIAKQNYIKHNTLEKKLLPIHDDSGEILTNKKHKDLMHHESRGIKANILKNNFTKIHFRKDPRVNRVQK